MTTGQKIKYYRESKKMSQKELGMLLNKSQGTVAKYENDTAEMDYATLKKFCDYAGCTIDYLLGRTEESENEIRKAPHQIYFLLVVKRHMFRKPLEIQGFYSVCFVR